MRIQHPFARSLITVRTWPVIIDLGVGLCGLAIFFGIIAFWTTRSAEILPLLALIWTSCSIEGITITLLLQKPMSNLHGIFEVLSMRKAVDA